MTPELAWAEAFKSLPSPNTIHIAYSGGLDSHVLLHSVCRMRSSQSLAHLHVVHIHHGLNPNADQWASHCQSVCEGLNVPCDVVHVDVLHQDKLGPEQAARQARYQALADHVQAGDWLVTAHHQDDQAETMLLQLFRGAGPEGLSGMSVCQSFAEGSHVRPLLGLPRSELESYAQTHQLQWMDDDSNASLDFDRNYVRHQVLPLIEQRWPAAKFTVARSAQLCGETADWIQSRFNRQLESQPIHQLSLGLLQSQDAFVQRGLFRAWLKRAGVRMPSQRRLNEMLQQCLWASKDRQPSFLLDDVHIERFQNSIYLLRNLPSEPYELTLQWDDEVCVLPDSLGRLSVRSAIGHGIADRHWQSGQGVEVCSRRGGETLKFAGRDGHRSLKQVFQDAGVPPWMRSRIPIVRRGDAVLAIADLWVNDDYAAAEGECGWVVEWDAPWRNSISEPA